MKMQVFFGVIFAVLLVGIHSEEVKDDEWTAEEESCVNELKLNITRIQIINKQDIVPEDDSDFNDFLSCYWKKKDVQGADGEIDFANFYTEFLQEFQKEFGKNPDISGIIIGSTIRTAINDCEKENIKGSTHGQTVAKLQNCVLKKLFKAIEDMKNTSQERK